jgi:phytol kinase
LVALTFGVLENPFIGAVGILVMGYGDGLAAVIGKSYGKHKLAFGKSIEGSITMFVASFIVVFLVSSFTQSVGISLILALGVSALATIVELITPKGLDNLSVPLSTSLIFYILLLII